MREVNETKPRDWKPFEWIGYFLLGGMILVIWGTLLWDRGGSPSAMGPIIQAGTVVIIPYSVLLMVLSLRRSSYARLLIVSTITVVATMGLVEIFLQVCDCSPRGMATMRLNRVDAIIDMREQGIQAFPYISPKMLSEVAVQHGSDYFLSNIGGVLTVYEEEDDGLVTSRTDENGFRNEEGFYSNTHSFDVFLIGDSFTEGCCVPDGYTIADVIRQNTPLTVYNAGKNGAGLLHKLAVFIEYGLSKKPKNVVLIMPEAASLNRATREMRVEQLREYYQKPRSKGLLGKADFKDTLFTKEVLSRLPAARQTVLDGQYETPERSRFGGLVRTLNSKSRIVQLVHSNRGLNDGLRILPGTDEGDGETRFGEGGPKCENTERNRTVLKQVASWLDDSISEYGGELFLVYIPQARFFTSSEWQECEHEMVVDLTEKLAIELIDMVPVLSSFEDPRALFASNLDRPTVGGHPNREGYRVIGEQIADRLVKNR